MQDENTKAAPPAQQEKTALITTGCAFWNNASTGHEILQVNPGIPCSDVMIDATTLNDGINCLLKRLADKGEGEGEANGMELQVLAMATATVGAMITSCYRAFERREGEA